MNRVRAGAPKGASNSRPSGRPEVRRDDPSSLRMVGLLALGGFVVGVVWPRLAGISLVPEAPIDEVKAPLALEAADVPPEAAAASTAEPAPKKLKPEDTLEIGESEITSCRDEKGKEQKACGELDVDALVHAELLSLTSCPSAAGAFGTFSIGFELDFDAKKVGGIKMGRSTDLPKAPAEELLRCAKKSLEQVSLADVRHEFSSYTVFYKLRFKTPEAVLGETSTIVPMSGQTIVHWQTALVRAEPERNAEVKARVLSGTRLLVTGRKGEWYRVRYDAKGREGWVHGAALALGK